MSSSQPGPGDFFEQFLGNMLNMLGANASGPTARVDLARTVAQGVATGGEPDVAADPLDRIRLEEFVRLAELQVTESTGLTPSGDGRALEVEVTGPGGWAVATVNDWRFIFEAITGSQSGPSTGSGTSSGAPPSPGAAPTKSTGAGADSGTGAGADSGTGADSGSGSTPGSGSTEEISPGGPIDPTGLPDLSSLGGLGSLSSLFGGMEGFGGLGGLGGVAGFSNLEGGESDPSAGPADFLTNLMNTLGPLLTTTQLASAIGHLSRTTLGQYELPVPRLNRGRLIFVPGNLKQFASDWSLPADQVELWICLRDVTTHAVYGHRHVADRVRELLARVVQGVAEDTAGMAQRLDEIDPSNPEALQRLIAEPGILFETELSPQRQRAADELMAVIVAVSGFVDQTVDECAQRLVGSHSNVPEAWRRRQVDRETADRAAELLIGLDLSPAQTDRGRSFVRGIADRAGPSGVARLWEAGRTLPTPSEVDAPGLWLARISIPEEESTSGPSGDLGGHTDDTEPGDTGGPLDSTEIDGKDDQ